MQPYFDQTRKTTSEKKWKTTTKKMKKWKTTSKKREDDLKKNKKKWKTTKKNKKKQSTKINLIGCDTIVNSPSFSLFVFSGHPVL